MENVFHLKCTCGHCGGILEYLPKAAGQIVECPHCHEKSRLPEPERPNPTIPDEPLEKPVPACPDCGAVLDAQNFFCAACAARRGKWKLIWGLGTAVILLAAGWLALSMLNRAPVRRNPPARKAGTVMLLPQPPVKLPKSMGDLKPDPFHLEPRRGNVPAFVTGQVQNISDNVHLSVRVTLDLLDAQGGRISVINDTIKVFKPRSSWNVLVTVTDPRAAGVRFVSLKEDQ